MKIKTLITLTIVFLLFIFSCKETPPEPGNSGVINSGMLTVEDVGVTDAVLRLRVPGGFKSRSITLKRDTTTILTKQIASLDTTIIDEELLPKHSYNYTLTVNNFLNTQERYCAGITTMDTTSHNFTWQIDTLGDGNSSILRDVAILNDTLAYAVGEIYKKDSTGNFEDQPYNVARWDGKQWQLLKLEFPLYNYDCTVAGYLASKTTTIFGFNPNSILISDGGSVAKWDGATLTQYPCILNWITNSELLKIWGRSENDFYVVGRNGTILQYYLGIWQKLESGTDLSLLDIYGSPENEIYSSGGDPSGGRGIILKMINGNWTKIIESYVFGAGFDETKFLKSQLFGSHRGIWVDNHKTVYTVGDFVFQNRYGQWRYAQSLAGNNIYASGNHFGYLTAIRGNAVNDIIIVGQQRTILHNNGLSWQHIGPKFEHGNSLNFYGVAINERMIIAVGTNSGTAIAVRLYK